VEWKGESRDKPKQADYSEELRKEEKEEEMES
jgi:hypothetical protein